MAIFQKKIPAKNFEKSEKLTNLEVLAPEKDSSGDLEEIPQKIVQIDALAATFWAKNKIFKNLHKIQKLAF